MTNELVPYSGGIQVIQRHSMFDLHGRTTKLVEYHYQSIEDLFRDNIPFNAPCVCSLNGEMIPRDEWPLTMVAPNDCVLFTPILQSGGGNKGMQIIGVLIMIVAAVLIATGYGAPLGYGMVQAGVPLFAASAYAMGNAVLYGAMVIGAAVLMAGMTPSLDLNPSAKASLSSWSPQTTQVQGGAVPKYYGEHKLVGNVIATYIIDATLDTKEVQYLYVLLDMGMGPYDSLSDFKINNIGINTLRQVTATVRNGYLDQEIISGFEKTHVTVAETQPLTYNVPVVRQTTGSDFDKLTIKTICPMGLAYILTDGNIDLWGIRLEVKVKRSVDSEWIHLAKQMTTFREVVTPGMWVLGYNSPDDIGLGIWTTLEYGGPGYTEHTEGDQEMRNGFVCSWHYTGTFKETVGEANYKEVIAATRNRLPIDYTYEIPADKHGQYDISVTRVSVRDERTNIINDISYYGYDEIEYDEFTYPRQVLVGIRALLTDQISGSFNFSCHAKASLVHVYDSVAQTWTPQWSNNPAWICYDILTSPVFLDAELNVARANQSTAVTRYDGADPSRLDLDSFVAYAAFCDTQLSEGRDQSVVVVEGSQQKYKCIKTHLAAENIKPGVDYYADKIPPTHLGLSGVGTVSANDETVDFEAWRAFDHLSTSGWLVTLEGGEAWIQFQFATPPALATPTRIRRYSVTWANGGEYAGSWVFEAWDGAQWVSLHSVTGFTGDAVQTTHTYTFTNNTGYDQYRLRVTENTHAACLNELEMFDSDESWQTYWEATADGVATTWSAGMRYYLGTEPRYTFNGGFDTRSSRWSAAMQVCAVSQSALLMVGTKIYVVIDHVKTPSQLITEGNLISFKEQFLDLSNRATEVSAEFKNLEKDYASDQVIAFLSNDPTMYGRADIKTFGLTKASEVWRIAKHAVVQNQKRHVCEVEMDIDAIASMVGDVVYLQSETPDWEDSHGGILLSATTTTFTLDREVTIAAGKTYTIMVRLAATDTIVTKTIAATTPGNYSTLTITVAWATIPGYGDIFAFGEVNKTVKTFSVANIAPTENHGATLTLIEYDADLYTQIDNTTPEIYTEPTVAYGSYVTIVSLVLAEGVAADLNGNLVRSIEAVWTPSSDGPAYAKGKVYLRLSAPEGGMPSAWILQTTTPDTDCILNNAIENNTSYDVMIVGVDTMGVVSPMNSPSNAIATIVIGAVGPDIGGSVTLTPSIIGDELRLQWNRKSDVWVAGYALYVGALPWNANITYAIDIPVSDSGTYYRSLQNTNINHAVSDAAWWFPIPAWSNATTYAIDAIVINAGAFYQSLQEANLNHLVTDALWWVPIPAPGAMAEVTQELKTIAYTYPATLWAGTYAFYLRTISKDGLLGLTDLASASIAITVPAAPPNLTGSTNGKVASLAWDDSKTTLSIAHYDVNAVAEVLGRTYTEATTWTGAKEFSVIATDVAGNVSTASTVSVTVEVEGAETRAVTAITCIGQVYAIRLLLTYTWFEGFQAVEIWASATNSRAAATLVGETTGTSFTHTGLAISATRYYWARIRDTAKVYGAWYPLSDTDGVMGTVSSNPSTYFDILDIDESRLSKTLQTRLNWLDSSPFVFTDDYCYPSTVMGMNGVFDTLAALQTSQDAAISAATIAIDEGIAGEWASISLKASTASVTALDSRVSIAELDVEAGKAGQWSSISAKATTAALSNVATRVSSAELDIAAGIAGGWAQISSRVTTSSYDADQKVGGVLRITTAEQNITAGQAGTWGSFTSKLGVATYNADQKDGNGYLRLAAMENRMEVYDTNNAVEWAGGHAYLPGEIVLCNGIPYRCVVASENEWPPNYAISWNLIDSGLLSQWTLKLTVNNHVAGVGMMLNDSGVSEFIVLADKFKIMHPNDTGEAHSVFIVGNINGVDAVGIRGDLIVDGSILANALTSGTIYGRQITLAYDPSRPNENAQIRAGKTEFSNAAQYGTGFCLGIDHVDGLAKFYIGNTTKYLNWTGNNLVVGGDIIATGNIQGSAVTTTKIGSNAVSQSGWEVTTGQQTCSSTLLCLGGRMHITFASAPVGNGTFLHPLTTFTVRRDSTILFNFDSYTPWISFTLVDFPTAEYHTYTVTASNNTVWAIWLQLLEVIR